MANHLGLRRINRRSSSLRPQYGKHPLHHHSTVADTSYRVPSILFTHHEAQFCCWLFFPSFQQSTKSQVQVERPRLRTRRPATITRVHFQPHRYPQFRDSTPQSHLRHVSARTGSTHLSRQRLRLPQIPRSHEAFHPDSSTHCGSSNHSIVYQRQLVHTALLCSIEGKGFTARGCRYQDLLPWNQVYQRYLGLD